jgi:hypothetical protein
MKFTMGLVTVRNAAGNLLSGGTAGLFGAAAGAL